MNWGKVCAELVGQSVAAAVAVLYFETVKPSVPVPATGSCRPGTPATISGAPGCVGLVELIGANAIAIDLSPPK